MLPPPLPSAALFQGPWAWSRAHLKVASIGVSNALAEPKIMSAPEALCLLSRHFPPSPPGSRGLPATTWLPTPAPPPLPRKVSDSNKCGCSRVRGYISSDEPLCLLRPISAHVLQGSSCFPWGSLSLLQQDRSSLTPAPAGATHSSRRQEPLGACHHGSPGKPGSDGVPLCPPSRAG